MYIIYCLKFGKREKMVSGDSTFLGMKKSVSRYNKSVITYQFYLYFSEVGIRVDDSLSQFQSENYR